MLKYFTRILIFTLVLTAPLSFTGDKCPDFKPASEIRQCQQRIAAAVVVSNRHVTTAYFTASTVIIEKESPLTPAFHFSPINACLNLPLHERAPPSITVIS